MENSSRRGQIRKEKNIKRIKKKEKKQVKNQIKNIIKQAAPPVNISSFSSEDLLKNIETKAIYITHKEFIEQLNAVINRDELALDDSAYDCYLNIRKLVLKALVEQEATIWKSIIINIGLDYSFVLNPISSEMIFKKYKTGNKKMFIDEMLNKACEFNILEEEGEKIYQKPINFKVKYWFNFKENKKVILVFKHLSDGTYTYFFEGEEDISFVREIDMFLKY